MNIFIENNDFVQLNDNIALCNGDSLEKLKQIADNSIDCVITDPPYFTDGLDNKWNVKELEEKAEKADVIASMPVGMKFDKRQGLELQEFISKLSKEVYRILKPGGFYISFSQNRLYHRMAVAIEDEGFEIRDMLIWRREGQAKAFSQDHFVKKMKIPEEEKEEIIKKLGGRKTPQLKPLSEAIVLAQKPKDGTFVENWLKYGVGLVDTSVSIDGKFPGTVIDVDKPKASEREVKHFTIKPIALMEHLIKLFSAEGAIICDPFLGSGTTGVACINTNRKFVGCELNEVYYTGAKDRMERTLTKT